MKKLDELIARVPELRAKARQRESELQAKLEKDPTPVFSEVVQLPLWPDAVRRLPNELLRSALFNARNRNQPRAYLKKIDVAVLFEGRITYQGEELRQDDETVWLQLIHLAREQPLGHVVEFTPHSFCKAIGWTICKGSYDRLRECLYRMQSTALAVYSNRLKRGVSLSMLPAFEWQDEHKQTLKNYRVQVAPQLVELFGDVHYTQLEWTQRLALPVGISTWLHGYYASHREPFPIKLSTIKKGAGITTERPAKLRELVEKALIELVNVGFLKSWEFVGELVHVKRMPSPNGAYIEQSPKNP